MNYVLCTKSNEAFKDTKKAFCGIGKGIFCLRSIEQNKEKTIDSLLELSETENKYDFVDYFSRITFLNRLKTDKEQSSEDVHFLVDYVRNTLTLKKTPETEEEFFIFQGNAEGSELFDGSSDILYYKLGVTEFNLENIESKLTTLESEIENLESKLSNNMKILEEQGEVEIDEEDDNEPTVINQSTIDDIAENLDELKEEFDGLKILIWDCKRIKEEIIKEISIEREELSNV